MLRGNDILDICYISLYISYFNTLKLWVWIQTRNDFMGIRESTLFCETDISLRLKIKKKVSDHSCTFGINRRSPVVLKAA